MPDTPAGWAFPAEMVLVPMATNASNLNQSGGEAQEPAEAKSLLQTAATIFIILAPILLGILFFHAWFD